MLEQDEADYLLGMDKVYSYPGSVDLSPGVSTDLQLEDHDGNVFFWLDIYLPSRNKKKARFQLRVKRTIVLARLCTAVPHTNPDGEKLAFPHLHRYREGYEASWAVEVDSFDDPIKAFEFFCMQVNLPIPDIQGGLS